MRDLDEAALDFETRYGLRSIIGGRHPGVGTANRIIPLGREYLELIAVVDEGEAATNRRSLRVMEAVSRAQTFATWAVRTTRLDDLRASLAADGFVLPDPIEGSRSRPDGALLRWRAQYLSRRDRSDDEDGLLPFVIEWHVPGRHHPGRMPVEHSAGATGIRHLVLGHPDPASAKKRLDQALGRGISRKIRRSSLPGVLEVVIGTPSGDLVIS